MDGARRGAGGGLEAPAGGSHERYRCPRRHRHRPPRQFGLRGRLPWEGNRGREYVADVERFFELTRGHVVIMGHRTFTSVPDFVFKDRDILEIYASDRPEDVLARFPSRVVFIGGGPLV